MTVSRVINGEGNVREETREQVVAAIKRLNYAPNRAARNLAGGSQLRIALMFDNPSASYLSEFLMGALQEATRIDAHLEIQSCQNLSEAPPLMRKLAGSGVDGFILPPPLCDDQRVLDLARDVGAFAIAVGPGKAEGTNGAVMIDDFEAALEMTKHIIGLGHRRVGFIIGNPEQLASERRLSGFYQAMDNAGIEVDSDLVVQGRFTYRSGLAAAEKLLSLPERPTAIFASNDDMAAAVVAVAHRNNLDVPIDITVCGFDDTALASTIWPELTTIRQPIREMTAWAVAEIASLVRGQRRLISQHSENTIMPHQLIRRDSDGAPSLASSSRGTQ